MPLLVLVLFYCTVASADIKVAFIADQTNSRNAVRVLKLIAKENAQLLLIQGDLGYKQNAASQWEANLNNVLGANFPVLAVVGNHENHEWDSYQRLLSERINRIPKLICEGDVGVKALCEFDTLSIVQVAQGIDEVKGVKPEDAYPEYIVDSFKNNPSKWRICSWHKNQTAMQVGEKGNETGWGVYEACLQAGAMIATGHEHSYSRTHLLSSFQHQSVVHMDDHLELDEGQSFAFVSGLGGKKTRKQKIDGDWWASIYSRTQSAKHGALFCTFAVSTASCYFKSIPSLLGFAGDIPDRFTLESKVGD